MKRFMFLSALLMAMFSASAVSYAEEFVFVDDMSVENGWVKYGNPNSHGLADGVYELDSVDGRGGFQRALPLEAGKEYVLNFDAKVEQGYLMPTVGVKSSNYDFEGKYKRITVRDGDLSRDGWMSYERRFTLPEVDVNGDYRLVFHSRNAMAEVDNVRILAVEESRLVVFEGGRGDGIVLAGEEDVFVGEYKFVAEGDDFVVENLAFKTDVPRNLLNLTLVHDGVDYIGGFHPDSGLARFNNLDFVVGNGEEALVTVYADVAELNQGAFNGSRFEVVDDFGPDSESDFSVLSSGDRVDVVFGGFFDGNGFDLYDAIPELRAAVDGGDLFNDGVNTLYEFDVTALGDSLALEELELELFYSRSDLRDSLSDFALYADGMRLFDFDVVLGEELFYEGVIRVEFEEEFVIVEGETVNFELKAFARGVDDVNDFVAVASDNDLGVVWSDDNGDGFELSGLWEDVSTFIRMFM